MYYFKKYIKHYLLLRIFIYNNGTVIHLICNFCSNTLVPVCTLVADWMDLATALNYVDFVVTLLIPFSLIVILNTLISKTVWKLARVRRSMTLSSTKKERGELMVEERKRSSSHSHTPSSSSSSSQTKVTEMLLIVSSVFICLNLPSYVVRVWVFVNEVKHYHLDL